MLALLPNPSPTRRAATSPRLKSKEGALPTQPALDLNEPCPACSMPAGDHTLRDFVDHGGVVGSAVVEDTPYTEDPTVNVVAGPGVNGISDACVMADHLAARALIGQPGAGAGEFPVLHLRFGKSRPARGGGYEVTPVAEVAVVGDPAMLRKLGVLVRDAANGAANRAEARRN